MSDDWRLRIDLRESGLARELTERLEATELEHDLERAFHDRVVVSRDGAEVFCYTGTREQARRVEQLVRSLAEQNGWNVDFELRRWHPAAEEWEDPDAPLPESDAGRAAERAELIEREREEAKARGYPEYEVRVECPTHEDAVALAGKLRDEGTPHVQRWRYLLVGALDQESAEALAERLRAEAPAGCTVRVEGTLGAVLEETPSSPFAILGGLGG